MSVQDFQVEPVEQFETALERFTFPVLRSFFRSVGTTDVDHETREQCRAWIARERGRVVGMLMVGTGMDSVQYARVLSLYVVPPARGRGIARTLLTRVELDLKTLGVQELRMNYVRGKASILALEHLLDQLDWQAPKMNMLVLKSHITDAVKAPWFREWKLPSNYQIINWDAVSEAQLQEIRDSHAVNPWIAEDLQPFAFLKGHDPETSLALTRDDKVRGWLINHRVGDTLRYTCSFVHPELQRKGRVLCLYSEAVRRMPQLGLEKGMWTVPKQHPAMQAFARRWMQPYCYHFSESMDVRKPLN